MKKIPWLKYKGIINNFHAKANQQNITWKRWAVREDFRTGKDRPGTSTNDLVLKGLIMYNDFRTWPITKFDVSGSLDKQSEVMILNKNYLKSLNLLDSSGRFIYNASKDRFVCNGITYEDAGSTDVAQASDEPLLFYIILKRVNG